MLRFLYQRILSCLAALGDILQNQRRMEAKLDRLLIGQREIHQEQEEAEKTLEQIQRSLAGITKTLAEIQDTLTPETAVELIISSGPVQEQP